MIAIFVVLTGTTGMISGVATALGEEIGWRGFLVPELAKIAGFTTTALISGAVWAVWHYPITPVVYAGWTTPTWCWMSCFTVVAIAISFAQAWLRLTSGSLWPPVFLHATHTLFMQQIFTPLTGDTGPTVYVAGDLGAAFVVVALIVALIVWMKRSEVPGGREGNRSAA